MRTVPGTLDRWFDLHARGTDVGTEVRAGVTTFMVMAYIIFANPIVLGYIGVPGLDGKGLPFAPTLTMTCLTAGVMSIAMGLATNYPLALAPGMRLNAVVAFELVRPGQQQQQHDLHRERGRRDRGRAPLASVIPALYMMSAARELAWDEMEDSIPAFVTMLVMPFTWSITNGIGAGFVTHVAIRVLNGRARQVHRMLYLAAGAFVVYFLLPLRERRLT